MICQFVHSECRCKDVDLVIHAGDQIYPDDEDIAHADSIFNGIYDGLSEDKQRSMRFRGRELWRNKYRYAVEFLKSIVLEIHLRF